MKYEIRYEESVARKDIPKMSATAKKRIKKVIEEKLMLRPEVFGKPLRRSLKGYRSLRVGDYRVVYRIEVDLLIVKVFLIAHRSVAYKVSAER